MTEIKAGTRGTWALGRLEGTVVLGEPDADGLIVVTSKQNIRYFISPEDFTPDPEPPTTVMVEMSTEWAQKWANDSPYPPDEATTVYTQAENEVIQACREALRKAGL